MHAETLAYMLHQLPIEQKVTDLREPVVHGPGRVNSLSPMVSVPAGPAVIGMPRDSGRFGWDNEFGELHVDVPAFEIDRYMVTNAAFCEFIEAGGYRERKWWTEEDWAWKEAERIEHPACWSRREASGERGEWMLRTMFDEVPLPPDWPAYVSHAEASAYARWAGKALPTEAQWQRAAHGAPHAGSGNFDFRSWDPRPVTLIRTMSARSALKASTATAGSGLPLCSTDCRGSNRFRSIWVIRPTSSTASITC